MDELVKNILVAAGEVEMLEIRTDRARARLVRALCEAMAAEVSPAAAAGMDVSELFNALRRRTAATAIAAESAPDDDDDIRWA
jgi:hypothetical protein